MVSVRAMEQLEFRDGKKGKSDCGESAPQFLQIQNTLASYMVVCIQMYISIIIYK